MAQIFTGGRSGSFFLLNFFYTQMRYANLYFSRAGNSNWASLPEERRCQSHPSRACVLDGWPRRSTCNDLKSVVSSFFGSSSAWSCSTMMWLKTWAPVFSCFVRSLEFKCEAWAKTRYLQAQPATPRAMCHPRPRAEDVLCRKASCPRGSWLQLASP